MDNTTLGSAPVVDDPVTVASEINTPMTPVVPTVSEPVAQAPAQPIGKSPFAVSEEPTAPEPIAVDPVLETPAEPAIPEPVGVGTPIVENTVMPDADAPVETKPVDPVGPAANTTKFQI